MAGILVASKSPPLDIVNITLLYSPLTTANQAINFRVTEMRCKLFRNGER